MILITTAGKVGSEAARQLAQRGEPVRVLVRSPDKAAALARNGIDVFQADLEIPASLDSAMRGVTHVVLVTQPVVKQELNVIDSAARAGVEHVVKITSKAFADSPIAHLPTDHLRRAKTGHDQRRASRSRRRRQRQSSHPDGRRRLRLHHRQRARDPRPPRAQLRAIRYRLRRRVLIKPKRSPIGGSEPLRQRSSGTKPKQVTAGPLPEDLRFARSATRPAALDAGPIGRRRLAGSLRVAGASSATAGYLCRHETRLAASRHPGAARKRRSQLLGGFARACRRTARSPPQVPVAERWSLPVLGRSAISIGHRLCRRRSHVAAAAFLTISATAAGCET